MATEINIIAVDNLGEGFVFDTNRKKIDVGLKVENQPPKTTTSNQWLSFTAEDTTYYIQAVAIKDYDTRPYTFKDLDDRQINFMYKRYGTAAGSVEKYKEFAKNAWLNRQAIDLLAENDLSPTLEEALKTQGKSAARPHTYKELDDVQLEFVSKEEGTDNNGRLDFDRVRNIYAGQADEQIPEEILEKLEAAGSIPAN